MVLRILLEYYRREKKVRLVILDQMFQEQPKYGNFKKYGIDFRAFKTVLEQYDPTFRFIDIARLFRAAWTTGNGFVNFESFFIAATER